ncbi:outer membrane protein assembly factor BamB family protein [Chitinophaga sp. ARDCPP14]|uniref:outer membrane protein assembly factor BamB family protein n=1 Tax=Chitinophaga sp. ARDCPP14 TaxID=3391139 RepID=UPI003F528EEB
MFSPFQQLEKVKYTYLHKQELIICYVDNGITVYKEEALVRLSSVSPWYACLFGDWLLFQPENEGPVQYLQLGSLQPASGTLEGDFLLYKALINGNTIYIPAANKLLAFNEHLHPVRTYIVGRAPVAIFNDKYFRMVPHLSAFSLADNAKIWELSDDALLEDKTMLAGSFFTLRNGVLIIRSKLESFKNYLTGFDADTGEICWQQYGYFPATQHIGDEIFVFSYLFMPELQGRLCIINSKCGEILKDVDITGELTSKGFQPSDFYRLAVRDHYLYIMAGYGKALYAYNMKTDKIDWLYKFDIAAEWLTDIIYCNGNLFITDDQGTLHVFRQD